MKPPAGFYFLQQPPMQPTLVILRHTFRESIVQPIYSLLLALAAVVLIIYGQLPFFTLGEDTKMFKDVGLDIVLLATLITTLFAASRSIYDEIEDRTMLALMSKPVRRVEVFIGKYLGIISAAAMSVAILGVVFMLATWWRIPTDYQYRTFTVDAAEAQRLLDTRMMHLAGLLPSLVLVWLEIAVLAAIGVAISTRVSLVVNLPVVILIYVAGSLTRFMFGPDSALKDSSVLVKGLANVLATLLPYLRSFDLREQTVFSTIALPGTDFAKDLSAVGLGQIWANVGVAALYAIAYITFAITAGMISFRNRELGGAEG